MRDKLAAELCTACHVSVHSGAATVHGTEPGGWTVSGCTLTGNLPGNSSGPQIIALQKVRQPNNCVANCLARLAMGSGWHMDGSVHE